jgi:hypothetical protein
MRLILAGLTLSIKEDMLAASRYLSLSPDEGSGLLHHVMLAKGLCR